MKERGHFAVSAAGSPTSGPVTAIAAYVAFSSNPNEQTRKAKISTSLFCVAIAPFIGFHDEVLGHGVGSFLLLACVILLGCILMALKPLLDASNPLGE